MVAKSTVIFLMAAMFALGFGVGKQESNEAEKEIIELSIELTKLKIKELKADESPG